MAGFDEGRVYYQDYGEVFDGYGEPGVITRGQARQFFEDLLRRKTKDLFQINQEDRNRGLDATIGEGITGDQLKVDAADILSYNAELAKYVLENPTESLPLLEEVANNLRKKQTHNQEDEDDEGAELPELQVLLYSSRRFGPQSIRELTSEHVSRLVRIPGIVTAASKPKHKATHMTIICSKCKNTKVLTCKPGLGGAQFPRYCDANAEAELGAENCGQDPFVVLPHKSRFSDLQTLKLQERPEDVPTGELPRNILMTVDRSMVGTIAPGTRITAVAIYSTVQGGGDKKRDTRDAVAIQVPYLRVVGIEEEAEGAHSTPIFTAQEEAEFREYASRPNVIDLIQKRIAPQIFGAERIKEAVACLLFGGSRKQLPDGTWRRGDINVLLLGDPSTAKSQFLKFASKTAPIAVYTSGKGSSAAGLTATVIRDSHGEFYLEGGAMVLADNGVVCIDEFDKMRPEDRVAIHEAMEQQTISIAKAGITTMLKSRTSVLAAANPPSGRYDDLKSAGENIELQTTILSRFDLIFIVKDERNADRDRDIAKHVLEVHRAATQRREVAEEEAREEAFFKRYLEFCRARVAPRLSEPAADSLISQYVELREQARAAARENESDTPVVPITVRQLEAVVRISESYARMQLQPTVTEAHVRRALDLFTVSTMDAVKSGVTEAVAFTEEQRAELHAVEAQIRRRIAIGSTVSERKLKDELVRVGMSEMLIGRCLHYLQQQGDVELVRGRRMIHRIR
ncbi:g8492 [Coccomyxa viridis]|uniref:DNA replication licensing factor MCM5 n=1 Tax=Coccomyxa viridis TaxID=1274662 RepID=A0ABP1G351_9CHLO